MGQVLPPLPILPLNERQAERQFDRLSSQAIQAGRIARDHVAILRREGRIIGWRKALANLQTAIDESEPWESSQKLQESQQPQESQESQESQQPRKSRESL